MGRIKINQITESINEVSLVAMVEKVSIGSSTNGNDYANLVLSDETGRIEAKRWNVSNGDIEQLKQLNICSFTAKAGSYRNVLQLKINSIELIKEESYADQGINKNDFLAKAPIDIEKEYNLLISDIQTFKNDTYRDITLKILQENVNSFKSYPAAINIHHNVVSGLFWHSICLYKNIDSIKGNYEYIDNIDWELAKSGAILHDIGKIVEMNGIIADDYTFAGKMIGHISIGANIVDSTANELKIVNDDVTKLKHVILSSHGKKEYGSPVEPSLMEAEIVSTFDGLDASLYQINQELQNVQDESWSAKIFSRGNRAYFKNKNNKK